MRKPFPYKIDKSRSSNYKYVDAYFIYDKPVWRAQILNRLMGFEHSWSKYFDNERQAALAVDKKMISMGRDPVNILKRKSRILNGGRVGM